MRKGLVNSLSYSNSLGNWAVNGSTGFTSGALDVSGGTTAQQITANSAYAGYFRSTGVTAGVPSTTASLMKWVSGSTSLQMTAIGQEAFGGTGGDRTVIFNGSTGALVSKSAEITSYEIKAMPNGYWLVVANFTPASTATSAVATYGVNSGTVLNHNGAGFFAGTLTAQQILAAGGIPLTTTIAASGAGGNYGLDWNGASAALALSSVPFQLSDEHYVIAGATPYSASGYQNVFSVNGATTNPKAAQIEFGGGVLSAYWQDDAGAAQVINTGYTVGVPIVITAFRKAGVGAMRVNGVQVGSSSTALGTATLTTATIGARGFGPSNFFGGRLGPVVIIKGPLTAAELLVIERGVAALTGPTGVKF